MKLSKSILFGFLIWLGPFIVGFLCYPIMESNTLFFKSIMVVTSTIFTMFFINKTYKSSTTVELKTGIYLGLIWLIINIGLDFVFLVGFFKTPVIEYLLSTGFSYLIIPAMTTGTAILIKK